MKIFRFLNVVRSSRQINRWLARRQWHLFKNALPALLAFLFMVACLGMVLYVRRHSEAMHQRYRSLVAGAIGTHNYEMARVVSLRGIAESKNLPDRLEWTYFLAVALNGLGQTSDADALVNIAAPVDRPGCITAHLGLAQGLLSTTNLTTNIMALAERHLKNAMILEPQSLIAGELMGRFYINTRKLDKARAYLMKIYSEKPAVARLIAVSYWLEHKNAEGAVWADRAITAYEQVLVKSAPYYHDEDRIGLVESLQIKEALAPTRPLPQGAGQASGSATNQPPQDTPQFWLGMVQLLLLDGKFAAAVQTLDQQMSHSSSALYSPALAEICALWAKKIKPDHNNGSALRLQLVQKGLTNAPDNVQLQLLLVQQSHADDKYGLAAKSLLNETVAKASGTNAAWWHFVLWTDNRIRGDVASARSHLKLAYQLAPAILPIQNDMAMDLASGTREEAARGLAIIQPLVDRYPNSPGLRDTRGQILFKLGRYSEALVDLTFALERLPNASDTRAVLTKCYAALGKSMPVPEVRPSTGLSDIRMLIKQGKYELAVAALENLLRTGPNPMYSYALADACAEWISKIPPGQTNSADDRIRLIQKGLKQNPEQPKLRAYLVQAALSGTPSALVAKEFLDQLVDESTGGAAAEWRLALGREARARGDLLAARRYLQTAFELAPHLTLVRAELSAVLASGSAEDGAQALSLIQPVIEQFPKNPEYREIRGRVLAGLGKYQEALPDLELATARLSNPTETRRILAQVYDALGKSQQAEQQRQLLKKSSPR